METEQISEESLHYGDEQGLTIDCTHESPRFSVINDSELDDGIAFMHKHGYAVFSDVTESEHVEDYKNLLWEFLEGIKQFSIRRDDPETWHQWPGSKSYGVINDNGIGQSDFMWAVRSNRKIKRLFARIWNTRDLLVSFDGCGIFRDWHYNPKWKTKTAWYHVDQNPIQKPNFCCVQGFLALTDQNEKTGGLIVYPNTHLRFTELQSITRDNEDFVSIPGDHPVMNRGNAIGRLVRCRAGDFIAWDSRLIHCNAPACSTVERSTNASDHLLRIVAYVSMSPVVFIRGQTVDQFRKKRKQSLQDNCTFDHWSTELRESNPSRYLPKVSLSKLGAYQRGLVIGVDVDDE